MAYYIFLRVLWGICVVFSVLVVVFFVSRVIPGDPAQIIAGELAHPDDVQRIKESLGLSKPIHEQFSDFILGILSGDLGKSFFYRRPVLEVILERFPNTVLLAVCAVAFSVFFGTILGIISGFLAGSPLDRLIIFISTLVYSTPNFWLGPILILALSVRLKVLPVSGFDSPSSLVLPTLTLGFSLASVLVRFIRNSLTEALSSDFVVFAHAKGITKLRVTILHALKNALLPSITVVSLQFGVLLSGAVVTETVFAFPGVGRLMLQAVSTRDYPLLQGCVLFIASVWVFVNILADLLYFAVDPRTRS
jgi:ABC-type dipeptide/oligopeptide/nickel transport system permease component